MKMNNWTLGITTLLLPIIFVSIFKYRIGGSSPIAVLVGGIVLSVGIVVVLYQLLNRVCSGFSDTKVISIAIGALLISAVVYGIYFEFPMTVYGDWAPLLTVIVTVVAVTFWIGHRTVGNSREGLRHGFLTAGISGVLCTSLISYEAITREVVFNALVAISSVVIPLVLGTIGAVFGLLGSSFAHRQS